jgi:vacuolar protein sorting-associated protein IST1
LTEEKAGSKLLPTTPETPAPLTDERKTPKLPDLPPTEDEIEAKGKPAVAGKMSTPPPVPKAPPEDDFEALTRRFEALKKR